MSSAQTTKLIAPPPPIVAIVAWLIPGAGYWLIGQRTRGLTIGITILLLFLAGIFIGGVKIVDAPSFNTNPLNLFGLAQKPWFIGQVLAGLPALLSAWAASGVTTVSHARLAEISTLYTAVAGMLNLLAVIDSTFRAANPGVDT